MWVEGTRFFCPFAKRITSLTIFLFCLSVFNGSNGTEVVNVTQGVNGNVALKCHKTYLQWLTLPLFQHTARLTVGQTTGIAVGGSVGILMVTVVITMLILLCCAKKKRVESVDIHNVSWVSLHQSTLCTHDCRKFLLLSFWLKYRKSWNTYCVYVQPSPSSFFFYIDPYHLLLEEHIELSQVCASVAPRPLNNLAWQLLWIHNVTFKARTLAAPIKFENIVTKSKSVMHWNITVVATPFQLHI